MNKKIDYEKAFLKKVVDKFQNAAISCALLRDWFIENPCPKHKEYGNLTEKALMVIDSLIYILNNIAYSSTEDLSFLKEIEKQNQAGNAPLLAKLIIAHVNEDDESIEEVIRRSCGSAEKEDR